MAKVLVLYYSTYGHIEQMAQAVAEGARGAGATVELKRVPETVPEHIARPAHFKLDQPAPPSPRPQPSTAARRPRCSPSSPTCCTSAWWLAFRTALPDR
jgi:hypothetical protein